jgi:hypothetical protein
MRSHVIWNNNGLRAPDFGMAEVISEDLGLGAARHPGTLRADSFPVLAGPDARRRGPTLLMDKFNVQPDWEPDRVVRLPYRRPRRARHRRPHPIPSRGIRGGTAPTIARRVRDAEVEDIAQSDD